MKTFLSPVNPLLPSLTCSSLFACCPLICAWLNQRRDAMHAWKCGPAPAALTERLPSVHIHTFHMRTSFPVHTQPLMPLHNLTSSCFVRIFFSFFFYNLVHVGKCTKALPTRANYMHILIPPSPRCEHSQACVWLRSGWLLKENPTKNIPFETFAWSTKALHGPQDPPMSVAHCLPPHRMLLSTLVTISRQM